MRTRTEVPQMCMEAYQRVRRDPEAIDLFQTMTMVATDAQRGALYLAVSGLSVSSLFSSQGFDRAINGIAHSKMSMQEEIWDSSPTVAIVYHYIQGTDQNAKEEELELLTSAAWMDLMNIFKELHPTSIALGISSGLYRWPTQHTHSIPVIPFANLLQSRTEWESYGMFLDGSRVEMLTMNLSEAREPDREWPGDRVMFAPDSDTSDNEEPETQPTGTKRESGHVRRR